MYRSVVTAVVISCFPSAANGELRTWTDGTGEFSTDAHLVAVEETSVRLLKRSGEIIDVPISRLSGKDANYAKDVGDEAKALDYKLSLILECLGQLQFESIGYNDLANFHRAEAIKKRLGHRFGHETLARVLAGNAFRGEPSERSRAISLRIASPRNRTITQNVLSQILLGELQQAPKQLALQNGTFAASNGQYSRNRGESTQWYQCDVYHLGVENGMVKKLHFLLRP